MTTLYALKKIMAYNMVLIVNKPCNNCLVSACCTQRCEDYAKWIFDNPNAVVAEAVEDMSYHDAIQHILMVENCYLIVKDAPVAQ